jgi:hypothetical protein
MKRIGWFLAALYVYLLAGLAQQVPAQTITLPQSCDAPLVATGFDGSGTIVCRQVSQADLLSPFARTFSNSTITLFQNTLVQAVLDNGGDGFLPGYVALFQSLDDPDTWAYCVLTATDGAGGITCLPTATNGGGTDLSNWRVTVILGPTVNGVPPWAGLGFDSTTALTVPAQGAEITLTITGGGAIGVSSVVYVWAAQDNINSWFVCSIETISAGTLTCFVKATSGSGTQWTGYYVSIVDLAGPDAIASGYSSTAQTLGTGSFTFVTQSGRFFPRQGTIIAQCIAAANPTARLAGSIVTYSGTSLVIAVPSTGVYGSGSCSTWQFFAYAPTTRISKYQLNGLQIFQTGNAILGNHIVNGYRISVAAGSVRDSTDTIDLNFGGTSIALANLTETAVVQAAQAGTITSAGTAVTGAGTAFTTNFSANGKNLDFCDQIANTLSNLSCGGYPTLISIGFGGTANVTAVADDTHLTTDLNIGASASAFTRGGWSADTTNTTVLNFFIVIAQKDSDGTVKAFAVSSTISGAPDLPAGYTFFRTIGLVQINAYSTTTGGDSIVVQQPMLSMQQGQAQFDAAPKAIWAGAIGQTALGVNATGVTNGSCIVTFTGFANVTYGSAVVLTGTVPTGFTTGTPYYVAPGGAANTLLFYTTQSDAYAGTNCVTAGSATNGWSFRYFTYTPWINVGFNTTAPIGGRPGTTTMHWDFNLAPGIGTNCMVEFKPGGLDNTTPAQSNFWLSAPRIGNAAAQLYQCLSANLAAYIGNVQDSSALTQGTWVQQSTTSWYAEVKVWSN